MLVVARKGNARVDIDLDVATHGARTEAGPGQETAPRPSAHTRFVHDECEQARELEPDRNGGERRCLRGARASGDSVEDRVHEPDLGTKDVAVRTVFRLFPAVKLFQTHG